MTFDEATTEYIARIDRDGGSEFANQVGVMQELLLRTVEQDLDEAFRQAVERCVKQ